MKKIIDIRTASMMTQKEFAKALGVSVSTVQGWEYGANGISLRCARKIIDFCKANNINYEN